MSPAHVSHGHLSPEDRARVRRMAQTICEAILGAERTAEDDADRVARRVVDRLRVGAVSAATPTVSPASNTPGVPVSSALDEPLPILLSTTMAARLLGCSVKAIYHRVAERQIPSSCIVRSGRRLLLHRERLLAAIDRKAGR